MNTRVALGTLSTVMSEHTPWHAEPQGVGIGPLSRDAALAFERWLTGPSLEHPLRPHRRQPLRRRARRHRLRRLWAVLACLFVLHALFASAFMRWALALFVASLAVRYVLARLRARRLARPVPAKNADLRELPGHTRAWLLHQQPDLPLAAGPVIGRLAQRLDALAGQPAALSDTSEAGVALRRLLTEELPELVDGFRRLPQALTQASLHERPSPERQLVEGLTLLDVQLAYLQERLAERDLNALATHLQYLRLKYGEQALSPAALPSDAS